MSQRVYLQKTDFIHYRKQVEMNKQSKQITDCFISNYPLILIYFVDV